MIEKLSATQEALLRRAASSGPSGYVYVWQRGPCNTAASLDRRGLVKFALFRRGSPKTVTITAAGREWLKEKDFRL